MSGVYQGLTAQELEALYSLSPLIPDFARIAESWDVRSAAVRAELAHMADVAYGDGPREDMTLFPAARPSSAGSPLLLFIHGGYWQETYKEQWLYLAPAFVKAGVAYAAVNYELAPRARMDDIVDQVRRAVLWAYRHAEELGVDRTRLFVAGHSAGGHLTAMLLLTDWEAYSEGAVIAPLRGGCAVSGLFDLEPIRYTSVNDALALDAESALRNSPLHLLRERVGGWQARGAAAGPPLPPLVCAVGGDETAEYLRQQAVFVEEWQRAGQRVRVVDMPGHHHFTVVDELGREGSPLYEAVMDMIEGRW